MTFDTNQQYDANYETDLMEEEIRNLTAQNKEMAEELRLWRWTHEEMKFHLIRNSHASQPWVVLGDDGFEIAFGETPLEAMRNADKRIF